jgi:hypothetical protein
VTIFADSSISIDEVPKSSESSSQKIALEDPVSQTKRGRTVVRNNRSSSSSSICSQEESTCKSDSHQTGEILHELQKISLQLQDKEDKEEKSTVNSFLSTSSPKTVEQSQFYVDESNEDVTQTEPNTSQSLLQSVVTDSYTKYKIVKIDDEEVVYASHEPDSENTPKSGPSSTKDQSSQNCEFSLYLYHILIRH